MTVDVRQGDEQVESEETRLEQESRAAFDEAVHEPDAAAQAEKLREAMDAARNSALAGAYLFLQRLVGLVAVALPFVVAVGAVVLGDDGIASSISAYYYSPMGNVFVGALCALGVFFLSYQYKPVGPGYEADNHLSYGAAAAVIGVALFPTAETEPEAWTGEWWVSTIHLLCACALFVLLAIFSLTKFTKTDPDAPVTPRKRQRNLVYQVCGWTIVAVILLVSASQLVDPPSAWHTLFWLESIGVVAFGISWLVKSTIFGLLADRAPAATEP
jgi:hypothetical protein